MAEETQHVLCPNGIQGLNIIDDQINLPVTLEDVVDSKPVLTLETNKFIEVEGLAPPEIEDVDASPGVHDDSNGLRNLLIGQAAASTHRDSAHYDISGILA